MFEFMDIALLKPNLLDLEELAIFFLFIFLISLFISLVIWSLYNGISPMPTSPKAKKCLFSLLPNNIEGKIYELGCGWGTLLLPLAAKYSTSEVIGLETSFLPYWITVMRLKCFPRNNIKLLRKDFFTVNLNDAALVVCYLYPKAMKKLKTKFESELQPGTFVISNTFAIPDWKPNAALEVSDLYHNKIYLYQKPFFK